MTYIYKVYIYVFDKLYLNLLPKMFIITITIDLIVHFQITNPSIFDFRISFEIHI